MRFVTLLFVVAALSCVPAHSLAPLSRSALVHKHDTQIRDLEMKLPEGLDWKQVQTGAAAVAGGVVGSLVPSDNLPSAVTVGLGGVLGGVASLVATGLTLRKSADDEPEVFGGRFSEDHSSQNYNAIYGTCYSNFIHETRGNQCVQNGNDRYVTTLYSEAWHREVTQLARAFRGQKARQQLLYSGLGVEDSLNPLMQHIVARAKAQTAYECSKNRAQSTCQKQSVSSSSVHVLYGMSKECASRVIEGTKEAKEYGLVKRYEQLFRILRLTPNTNDLLASSPAFAAAALACLRVVTHGDYQGDRHPALRHCECDTGGGVDRENLKSCQESFFDCVIARYRVPTTTLQQKDLEEVTGESDDNGSNEDTSNHQTQSQTTTTTTTTKFGVDQSEHESETTQHKRVLSYDNAEIEATTIDRQSNDILESAFRETPKQQQVDPSLIHSSGLMVSSKGVDETTPNEVFTNAVEETELEAAPVLSGQGGQDFLASLLSKRKVKSHFGAVSGGRTTIQGAVTVTILPRWEQKRNKYGIKKSYVPGGYLNAHRVSYTFDFGATDDKFVLPSVDNGQQMSNILKKVPVSARYPKEHKKKQKWLLQEMQNNPDKYERILPMTVTYGKPDSSLTVAFSAFNLYDGSEDDEMIVRFKGVNDENYLNSQTPTVAVISSYQSFEAELLGKSTLNLQIKGAT